MLIILLPLIRASVIIYNPPTLREHFAQKYPKSSLPSSLGNFGNPPYGTSLVGTLFRPEDPSERDGCGPLKPIQFSQDDPDHNSSPILLIDRGTCSFVVKVRHAEDIGARMVLIVNNEDTEIDYIIMTDNGLGGNLKIPAFLITKEDGEELKSYLDREDSKYHINIAVTFDMKKGSDKVKAWVYNSPTSLVGRQLMADLSGYMEKFTTKNLEFYQHFVLWFCPECAASGYKTDHKDCISGGRYCFLDPDEVNDDVNGRHVILEDLRLMCLFNLTNRNDYSEFFYYQKKYHEECRDSKFLTEDCSRKIIEGLGIKYEKVSQCVNKTFAGNNLAFDDNSAMGFERYHILENYIPFSPAVIINDQLYRGDLEALAVFDAICAGYGYGLEPAFCVRQEEDKGKNEEKQEKTSKGLVVVAVIVSVLLVAAVLIVYRTIVRKDLNRDMRVQVDKAVAQYFQLAEIPSRT